VITKQKRREKIQPYLYILPSVAVILFVYFSPMMRAVNDIFYRISSGKRTFVGIGNYAYLLIKDNIFWIALLNNLKLLMGIPVLVFGSLIIAALLYQQIIGWKLFRIMLLIPYILSITVVGIVFDYILRLDGVLNITLEALYLNALSQNWLGNPRIAMYSIMGVVIWKEMGFGIILFLARMLSIDSTIFEAARIDGASWFRIFFRITIPELKNVIFFYVIINIINMLSWMFNYVFVMTRGGPMNSTYVLEYYIYRLAIRFRQFGMASALSVILFLIAFMFVFLQFIVRSKAMKEEVVY
jgi:ABC-type sugar transport system permease subunit